MRFLVAILTFFLSFSASYAEGGLHPVPVDEAFQLTAHWQADDTLVLNWQMPSGYYLYRDKIHLSVQPGNQTNLPTIELPQGKPQKDELHGSYQAYYNQLTVRLPIFKPGMARLQIHYQGCSASGFCYAPQDRVLTVQLGDLKVDTDITADITDLHAKNVDHDDTFAARLLAGQKFIWIMLGFLGLGILLAFTPCVLPMVPIISTLIVGSGRHVSTRRAFLLSLSYVCGMAIAYAGAGMAVALAGSRIQIYMQMPAVLIAFSVMFVLLAFSLFGWYDIQLPQRWQNRVNAWTGLHHGGSYVGVFTMGVLSSLVLSPCVSAPLVGVLAYISQSGDVYLGGAALMCLGLGMGLPLLLVGTTAGKLLPKSGAWMQNVKQLFGFMMLGMAIWILGRLISDSVQLGLWALLFIAIGVAIWRLKHSLRRWHKWHQGLGLFVASYALILLGGAINGQSDATYFLQGSLMRVVAANRVHFETVTTMQDLDKKLAEARLQHRPVILDFYADWCVACTILDKHVFSQAEVKQALCPFVLLRADVTKNNTFDQAVLDRFHIVAPPALLFFAEDGHEASNHAIYGEVSASSFVQKVQQFKQSPDIHVCANNPAR